MKNPFIYIFKHGLRTLIMGAILISVFFSGLIFAELKQKFQVNKKPAIAPLIAPPTTAASPAIADSAQIAAFLALQNNLTSLDFVKVAKIVTPSVVHIQTVSYNESYPMRHFLELFKDKGPRPLLEDSDSTITEEEEEEEEKTTEDYEAYEESEKYNLGSGSGVILTSDGYIVTNRHVVEDTKEIQVILKNRTNFKAKIIAADPATDLAIIKIEADKLQPINIGNSNDVEVGQWVMAVGNPFDLSTTVTTGIVSAKARNLNLMDKYILPIVSFIQTDAAINPGNSGGALVNTKGELVGINTAIASPTGVFAGYGFAVPSNVVYKVANDIIQYGRVKRGILGVHIRDVDGFMANEFGLPNTNGVMILTVSPEGGAHDAGLSEGDVIKSINGHAVNSSAELQELISLYHPGDTVKVVYLRNKLEKTAEVLLRMP